jgi:cell division protein FtsN
MDTLIELIVRALIALFTGGSERKPTPLPPPRSVPKIPPIQQASQPTPDMSPQALRQWQIRQQQIRQQQLRQQQQQRQQAKRQQPMRRQTKQQLTNRFPTTQRAPARRGNAPPPIPQPVAPPPIPKLAPARPAPAATTSAPAAISAAAIRQLMLSRRNAMRTIYVLSEVVGPPLALRQP